jgi:hypothetical protein
VAVLLAAVDCAAKAQRPTTERHIQAYVALGQLVFGVAAAYRFGPYKGRLICQELTDDLGTCRGEGYLRSDPSPGGRAPRLKIGGYAPWLHGRPVLWRLADHQRLALRGLFVIDDSSLSRAEGAAVYLWLRASADEVETRELFADHRKHLMSSIDDQLSDIDQLLARCRSLSPDSPEDGGEPNAESR